MELLKTHLLSLLALMLSVGCAQSDFLNLRKQQEPPTAELVLPNNVPVETFLIAPYSIPNRLKAGQIDLQFASNVFAPQYECKTGQKGNDFESCPDKYVWDHLVHGKSYSLTYRAKDPESGRSDSSPVKVKFTSDQTKGKPAQDASGAAQRVPPVEGVKDLPRPTKDHSSQANRNLLLGPNSFLIVPFNSYVYYYSSSSSLKGETNAFTLLGEDGSTTSEEECRGRGNSISEDDDLAYCESFPRIERLKGTYSSPFADNMIVLTDEKNLEQSNEIIRAAFFNADDNYQEESLQFETNCGNAVRKDDDVPYSPRSYFFSRDMVTKWGWCLEEQGDEWVWKTFYSIALEGPTGSNARLRVIHEVRDTKIMTSGRLLQKSLGLLSSIIIPSAIPLAEGNP